MDLPGQTVKGRQILRPNLLIPQMATRPSKPSPICDILTWSYTADGREAAPLLSDFVRCRFFKTYNDTYGHQAGDDCLQQVAKALSHCNRPTDLVARYEKKKFAVILPNTH